MIDKETARQIVYDYVNPNLDESDDEGIILDEYTRETEDAWVFSVQSRKFLETGDARRYLRVGTGPYIVNKNDGSVYTTGSLDVSVE